MQRLTVKTSTIFIAKGGKTRVYRSAKDVPKDLREELERSTNGFNSATILIADKRGRDEIGRALSGLPTALRTRLQSTLASASAPPPPAPPAHHSVTRFMRRNWLEILLPAVVGAGLWFVFNYR